MKAILQILTLLLLITVALSSTNKTLIFKTTEILTETIKQQNKSLSEQNSLLYLTNNTLILATADSKNISTKTIQVQSETLSEEIDRQISKGNIETTTQIETIEEKEEVTTKLPNDAVYEYITTPTNLKTNSILKESTSVQPIAILENKPLIQDHLADIQPKLLNVDLTKTLVTESVLEEVTTIKPIKILETKQQLEEMSTKLSEVQTKSFSEKSNNENLKTPLESQSFVNEITTKPLISFEDYAVKQLNFILDHMLIAFQEFVYKVLQATGNSKIQRDDLKRYAENLDFLLNPEDYYSEEVDDEEREEVKIHEKQPVDINTSVQRKLSFIKGKSTEELQSHLPQEWVKAYKTNEREISMWLDKAFEKMRDDFNRYVSEEEDNLKYQYFNESFDDIIRANEIHQKLAIIADLIKIVKNQKQISFMDLYMQ